MADSSFNFKALVTELKDGYYEGSELIEEDW